MLVFILGVIVGILLMTFLFLWKFVKVLKIIKRLARWANQKAKKGDSPFAKKISEFARKVNEQVKQVGNTNSNN